MKIFTFALLSVVGLIAGLIVGAQASAYERQEEMLSMSVGGTIAGMIVGAIAVWFAGDRPRKD
jgi:membrane associated rhomboid family serine protease